VLLKARAFENDQNYGLWSPYKWTRCVSLVAAQRRLCNSILTDHAYRLQQQNNMQQHFRLLFLVWILNIKWPLSKYHSAFFCLYENVNVL
jgi:hypothetical protein